MSAPARGLLVALAALSCLAPSASGRIVRVDTPHGPVWTNVPEPAANEPVRLSAKRERWLSTIEDAAKRHGVSPALVEAIVACESAFDPKAVSRAGACGLMQLMPATARDYDLVDLFEPEANVDVGTRHLASLLDSFDGDRRLAIAAYNAGEGAVRRAGGVPPFRETRRYLKRVESYLRLLGDAQAPAPRAQRASVAKSSIAVRRDPQGRLLLTNLPAGRKP